MKIILSHDVDHLYWKEHYFKDLFLPGLIYRNLRGYLNKQIDTKTLKNRLFCYGRLHRLPELITLYKDYNLSATFFFGMRNGLNLSYNYRNAKPWLQELISNGHKVGVHGMAYNEKNEINQEFERFKEMVTFRDIGVRTHYLRMNENTLDLFNNQGYIFDSSVESIEHPYKIGSLWEIPISIMDASLVNNAQMNLNLELWKLETNKRLELALEKAIPYFVINFHDIYFSETYLTIKHWYIWLLKKLKSDNYDFINFEDAILELNSN